MFYSLFIIGLGHFFTDLMIGIWPVYKTLAGLDVAKAGLISGLCMILGEMVQLIFGFVSDRKNPKLLMTIGLFMASCGSLLAYTENYVILFLIILVVSLGSGAFHPSAAGMVGNWTQQRKGFLITCFYTGGTIGAALSQIVFAQVWAVTQGQTIIFLLPMIAMGLWVVIHQFPEKAEKHASHLSLREVFESALPQKRELFTLYLIQVIMQTTVIATMFLLPDLLSARGYPYWFAMGGGDFFFVFGAACLGVVAGYLSDHYSSRTVLLLSTTASALSLYVFLFAGAVPTAAAAALLALMGGAMGMTAPLIIATGMRLVPSRMGSLVSGLLMGGATCIAGAGLMLASWMTTFFWEEPVVKALEVIGCGLFPAIFLAAQVSSAPSRQYIPAAAGVGVLEKRTS